METELHKEAIVYITINYILVYFSLFLLWFRK